MTNLNLVLFCYMRNNYVLSESLWSQHGVPPAQGKHSAGLGTGATAPEKASTRN